MGAALHPFEHGLDRGPANVVPLTPASFLAGAAAAYAAKVAVIDGARRMTDRDLYARCRRLASAPAGPGVGRLDLRFTAAILIVFRTNVVGFTTE